MIAIISIALRHNGKQHRFRFIPASQIEKRANHLALRDALILSVERG